MMFKEILERNGYKFVSDNVAYPNSYFDDTNFEEISSCAYQVYHPKSLNTEDENYPFYEDIYSDIFTYGSEKSFEILAQQYIRKNGFNINWLDNWIEEIDFNLEQSEDLLNIKVYNQIFFFVLIDSILANPVNTRSKKVNMITSFLFYNQVRIYHDA